jgi:hypothetical protein
MAATKTMLGEIHGGMSFLSYGHDAYALGRIGNHDGVTHCLPSGYYGVALATAETMQPAVPPHPILG